MRTVLYSRDSTMASTCGTGTRSSCITGDKQQQRCHAKLYMQCAFDITQSDTKF
jgi:hypothetical protein